MIGRKMFGILICLLLMVTVLPHGTFTVDANYVSENYDLLILTYNEDFKNAFKPLQQYHNNTGVPTVIKTVDDVESEQGGRGPREIQGFIQDAHNNWGVNYVLLGGDTDFIPVRYLYVSGLPPPYSTLEIPADMYYGCFGTWNGDGDSRYGEVEDNVDFTPSVYVGRACVDNTEDINNFVQKTIDYLENSVNQQLYLRDILGVGEYLGFEPGSTDYGAYFVDDILSMLPTDGG
ncbi:MAG TPA: hypothetical protein ENI45_04275, partial [Thermoplasmatales archaeon]|nr:hypothetical protein [Thermoplasmatales archaeon]